MIAPQWLGDAVMCEPLIAALAARGDRITVAALPQIAPVFGAMAGVADVVTLPFAHGRLDLVARVRLGWRWRGRYDVAYVLPNSLKSALVPWLARIPERVGYAGEGRAWMFHRRIADPQGRPPMVAHYGALFGPGFDTSARPRLTLADDAIVGALAPFGLTRGTYWAFAPGAEYGPAKRWPAEHYATLARSLHARTGLVVALLGSGHERGLAETIAASAPGACRVLAGETSLDAALAIVAGARALVSNDSGLMHVAAAFGVAQVALFGSTSPLHTPPLNPRARVVWLKDELRLDCMPCFDRQCRFGHLRCLAEITPERAERALFDALDVAAETPAVAR